MKNFLMGAVTALLLFVLGTFCYLRFGFAEVRADLPPGRWETALMTRAVHASVRRQAPEIPNPIAPTDENLIAGAKIYLNNCSGCHGTPGKPSNTGGSELFPPVPQLAEVGSRLTESQIFWVSKHGIRRTGMFANGMWVSDEDLWRSSAFIYRIKSLPPAVRSAVIQLTTSH